MVQEHHAMQVLQLVFMIVVLTLLLFMSVEFFLAIYMRQLF